MNNGWNQSQTFRNMHLGCFTLSQLSHGHWLKIKYKHGMV